MRDFECAMPRQQQACSSYLTYQHELQMVADEEALRAAAATLKLQHYAANGAALDAALLAMQRGLLNAAGAGAVGCWDAHPAALQDRIGPPPAAEQTQPPPREHSRFEPSSPVLVAPVPVRPRVLGSGASAFKPTAAALNDHSNVQHAAQLLQARSPQALLPPQLEQYAGNFQPPVQPSPVPAGLYSTSAHSPPKCRVSLTFDKPGGPPRPKQQFSITASCGGGGGADPLNGLLQAINYLDMHGGAPPPPQHALIRCGPDQAQRAAAPTHSPHRGASGGGLSAPSSPPSTPPRCSHHVRTAARSPARGLRSPHALRPYGGVSKAKSPGLQERLAHCQRGACSTGSTGSTAMSSPASSGNSSGTGNGSSGGTGATSHPGAWTDDDKAALMSLVQEAKPCGAVEWEAVANRLGRWSKGGASAERMYRTLADPQYQKSSNRHGCRLNPRDGTPMHVMVEYALERLPGKEGNIDAIAAVIEAKPEFARQLDYSARPGTKTYPRWKDTLLGCFKTGRYRHLMNTHIKVNGKNMYRLVATPPK